VYAKTSNENWELVQKLDQHSSKVLCIDWASNSNNIVTCGAVSNNDVYLCFV